MGWNVKNRFDNEYQIFIRNRKLLITRKIQDRLNELGLNQYEFADLVKVHAGTTCRWLTGMHNFTIDTLFLIEKSLDIKLFDVEEKIKEKACP